MSNELFTIEGKRKYLTTEERDSFLAAADQHEGGGVRTLCLVMWCVPGMGMILWGASPLYIFQKGDNESTLKSTSRRQGREGDRASERSRSANL